MGLKEDEQKYRSDVIQYSESYLKLMNLGKSRDECHKEFLKCAEAQKKLNECRLLLQQNQRS